MLCSRDFHRKSPYNNETKDQMWMSIIGDSHDAICGCDQPFAHLLTNIFPLGHTDRDKTINQIIWRDFKQLCRSGGDADKRDGCPETSTFAAAATTKKDGAEEEDPENLEKLFAENAAEEGTR